uniref:NADH dehydrogenase subunit 1 n=1 Tax=Parasacculina shiinoi TaxID=2836419 RepID=UPI002551E2DA|nr:NADH dehydrogenase subunit 1 [Parasacculina shiinoi]WGU20876.1 NADH dehydrogenase subunit 1 [Parasacculina shiinoi]
MISFLSVLFIFFSVMLGVNFFVLFERKFLSLIHIRSGPDKSFFYGILHSFSDAVKLLKKKFFFPVASNFFVYFMSSLFMIFLSLVVWLLIPYMSIIYFVNTLLLYLAVLSLGVFPYIFTGWSSNSKYSFLGSLRIVAQTVSYEISMIMVLVSIFFHVGSYSFYNVIFFQNDIKNIFSMLFLLILLLMNFLAELHRVPFDFSESESELVSGFNVEYGGCLFTFVFLSEYINIMFMMSFIVLLFMGLELGFFFFFFFFFFVFFLVLIRGSMPRYRYDTLMFFCWFTILPLCIMFLIIYSMAVYI